MLDLTEEVFKRREEFYLPLGTVVYATSVEDPLQSRVDEIIENMRWWKKPSDRSKWERIGKPMTLSILDWGLIISPYTPPKTKWQAIERQIGRFMEAA